jgi:hypothetical protein
MFINFLLPLQAVASPTCTLVPPTVASTHHTHFQLHLFCNLLLPLQLKEASASPGTLTPPAVARFLGVYSMAVYQAFAVWSPPQRRFLPLTSDILNVATANQFTVPAGGLHNGSL